MAGRKDNKDDTLRRAYENVANTPEGLMVLRHIFGLTGYEADTMRADRITGEINSLASLVNQSRRTLWLFIQKELSRQARIAVEIPPEDAEPKRKREAKKESEITEIMKEHQED